MKIVDASLVLDAIVAASIAAGAFFTVIELRSMSRGRKMELLLRLSDRWNSRDFSDAMVNWAQADFTTAETAEKTCPKRDLVMMAEYFDWVAGLARNNVVDEELIDRTYNFVDSWDRMKLWCLHWRGQTVPGELTGFEWMADKQRNRDRAGVEKRP